MRRTIGGACISTFVLVMRCVIASSVKLRVGLKLKCHLSQGYKANVKKDAFEFEFYK